MQTLAGFITGVFATLFVGYLLDVYKNYWVNVEVTERERLAELKDIHSRLRQIKQMMGDKVD